MSDPPSRRRSGGPSKAIHVVQGEQRISDDLSVMLTTLLGSCVAACLRDPVAGVGGMNHFLLPGDLGTREAVGDPWPGIHAMEMLIDALLDHGAARHRLEAKIFGGASMKAGLTDVGTLNVAFARQVLERESIGIVGECLGGTLGRRVQYWPVSGRARRIFLRGSDLPFDAPRALPATAEGLGSPDLC